MSGVFGLFKTDGSPVAESELRDMASLLAYRGPDRTEIWHAGSVGLGLTLLATTPEAQAERVPFEHRESGCAIAGDIRLDNRGELLSALGIADRAAVTGDAEIVLRAYLRWGEHCVERLLGDFAFAVWDPRSQRMFCARDRFGMRSLVYHHAPRRLFAFATEPRAVLVLPQTPYRINEGRIADFLVVPDLEGIDKTSTFFEEVFRLPAAHTLTVTPEGQRLSRYWQLEPEPELRLGSDEEYAEAFLEVFTEAVRCRLRTAGPPGSMLSGGMDSGTIVAVARELLAAEGRGPLQTFSAVTARGGTDPETQAIEAALTVDGIEPHVVSCEALDELLPELAQLTFEAEEPFDANMTLVRAVYLAAHRNGLKALLDGALGDVVLTEGRHLSRLLRAGRWRTAYREAAGLDRFWKGLSPPGRALAASARAAFVPDAVLRRMRPLRGHLLAGRTVAKSPISEELARRVDLAGRLEAFERLSAARPLRAGGAERALELDKPHVTAARERYDRVAASAAVEPRDPFLDVRVVAFCARLPDRQVLDGGWPKPILRRATAGRLADEVRWRLGKEHLGWTFTRSLMDTELWRGEVEASLEALDGYVSSTVLQRVGRSDFSRTEPHLAESSYTAVCLGSWLKHHAERPRGRSSGGGGH